MSRDKMIKNEVVATIISVVVIVVVLLGFTYGLFGKSMGFFSDTNIGSNNVIQFGDIGMTFCDNSNCASGLSNVNNSLNINTGSTPMTEIEALSTTPYRFTLTNTGTLPLTIKIILNTVLTSNSSTISESELKNNVYVAIQEQGVGDPLVTLLTDLEDNILGSTTIGPSEAKTYELWTWVREDAPNSVQGAAITTSVRVQGEYIPYSNLPEVLAAVIFDKQGGTGGSDRVVATYGEAMPTATAPTRTAYTFGGYYSEPNGKGTKYYDEEMNSVRASNLTNDKTLYAKWSANTYIVYLDANGGTIPETEGWTKFTNGYDLQSAYKTVTYDSIYGDFPTPTKDGYSFDGWVNIFNYGNLTMSANGTTYHNTKIFSNSMPGVIYTVSMTSSSVTSGEATLFETRCYNYTLDSSIGKYNEKIEFGNNIIYNLTCSATYNKTDKLAIIIYSGIAGSAATVGTQFNDIKLNTTNDLIETIYTSSSIVHTDRDHQLFAKWRPNT